MVLTGNSAPSNAVNDFTVNVYAKEKVKIRAKQQQRSRDQKRDEKEQPRPKPKPEPKPQPKPNPRPDPAPIIDVRKYDQLRFEAKSEVESTLVQLARFLALEESNKN